MDPTEIILVHQLLGQYGHIVDAGAWDRFDELFTDDAVLDYTAVRAPRVFNGIEEIRAYFRETNHPSAHHVMNIVVWEEAGETRVHSKFLAPSTRPSHNPKRWFGGDYHDVVVKTDGGWRFRTRVCTGRWRLTAAGPDEKVPEHHQTW
jgi:hypothetical protein